MKSINELLPDLRDLQDTFEKNKSVALVRIGNTTANAFQDNITNAKNVDGSQMKRRSPEFSNRKGRATLIKSGNLRRAISVLSISKDMVEIGIGDGKIAKYAKINNEGGEVAITPKMRRFFWAKHFESRNKQDRQTWKNLAMKRTPIKVPKRQFIGVNDGLEKQIYNDVSEVFMNT